MLCSIFSCKILYRTDQYQSEKKTQENKEQNSSSLMHITREKIHVAEMLSLQKLNRLSRLFRFFLMMFGLKLWLLHMQVREILFVPKPSYHVNLFGHHPEHFLLHFYCIALYGSFPSRRIRLRIPSHVTVLGNNTAFRPRRETKMRVYIRERVENDRGQQQAKVISKYHI